MDSPPLPAWVFSLLATALFVAVVLRRRRRGARKYNLPPGPRPLPVIGNLHQIGPLPHRSLHELAKRHGPLMSLRFGSFPVVVGSSVDAARFFLKTHDLSFIDRPQLAAAKHTLYDSQDLLWAPYGAYWRQGRRLWQSEFLSPRRLKAQEPARAEEVRAMLRDVRAATGGAVITIKEHLLMLSVNVISRMALGKKYVFEGPGSLMQPPEFMWLLDELFFLNGTVQIGDVIPWLSWLDPQGYVKKMKSLHAMFDRFLEQVVEKHEERRRREGEGFVPVDIVDKLLELTDDPNLEVPLNRVSVKAHTLDLLGAATDPPAVAIEWALTELLRNPKALSKATEELDRVVGRERLVEEADIASLPYLEAVVKETMRVHPVAPLLSPRVCREDTSFAGYDIPAGARVVINTWTLTRDPAAWGDSPEEFRPERFAGSDVDVKGQDMELLPFGSGRRMCPGHALGLKVVQLGLANLLHAFAWRLPDGVAPEGLDVEEKFGLSSPRKFPLEVVAEPRLPEHLYAQP